MLVGASVATPNLAMMACLASTSAWSQADPPLVSASGDSASPRGALEVDSSEPGGEIWLDGNDTGEHAPAVLEGLLPGEYQVEVRLRRRRGTALVVVEPRSTTGIHVRLSRRAPIHLESVPSGAAVFLDDVRVGLTPLDVPDDRLGVHELSLKLDGYRKEVIRAEDEAETRTVGLALADWTIRWSVLYPLFEVDRRIGQQVWLGARVQFAAAGFEPTLIDNFVGVFVSGALLLHQRLEPPGAFWGLDLYGGIATAFVDYRAPPNELETATAFFGSLVGVAGRAGAFELLLEVNGGLIDRNVRVFFVPSFAVRHIF